MGPIVYPLNVISVGMLSERGDAKTAVMARAVSLRKEGVVLKNHLTAPPLREPEGKAVSPAA